MYHRKFIGKTSFFLKSDLNGLIAQAALLSAAASSEAWGWILRHLPSPKPF
jgi:hypothetical protein